MLIAPPRDAEVPLPHTPQPDEIVLTWTVHLLRGQTGRLPRIGLATLIVFGLGLFVLHSLWLALLLSAALPLSLSEFLFPSRYVLSTTGASARHGLVTSEIAWRDVRHAYLAPDGIKLSPLPTPGSRLEPLRGVFLRFAGNDVAVIAAVRRLREGDPDA